MADQELGVKVKTTSDVPEAMNKAKSAVVSFDKQVQDIQKKFSTAFKDIFLSFLGPMALLGTALAFIGKIIADSQQKQAEATKAAIDGTNQLMSEEDKYWARKQERLKQEKETKEQAKLTRQQVTQQFLLSNDPRAAEIMFNELRQNPIGEADRSYTLSRRKDIQEQVQKFIAEDAKKNPELGAALGPKKDFKGPEGFSNVVGVGPNPVIEAMNEALEIQKQQLEELKKIANPPGTGPTDFTKTNK